MYCLGCWFQTDYRLSNRYICLEPNREKEGPGHHFHSLFPFKSARYGWFRQKYLFDTYTYTLSFPNRPYLCLTFLVSSTTHHHYSVLRILILTIQILAFTRRGTGTTPYRIFLTRQGICMLCRLKPVPDIRLVHILTFRCSKSLSWIVSQYFQILLICINQVTSLFIDNQLSNTF